MQKRDLELLKQSLKEYKKKKDKKKSILFINHINNININDENSEITIIVNSMFGEEKTKNAIEILKNFFYEEKHKENYNIKVNLEKTKLDNNILTKNTNEVLIINSNKKNCEKKDNTNLNQKYTFQSFIVGENSRFAYNLCLAIAKKPSFQYNPCLIYGDVGLGKTHLVQATGNEITKNSDLKVLYMPCEKFIDDFYIAIAKNKGTNYKNLFKKTDVLILDDIHLLEGKTESAQEALFNIFNSLKEANKQLIFTCDKPITAIKLEDRLKSRLGSGISADLKAPDYEIRLAIINQKCKEKSFELDKNVKEFIAKNVITNIRNLENCITTLYGFSNLLGKNIDINITKEVLSDMIVLKDVNNKEITNSDIVEAVAEYFNISQKDIRGNKRTKSLVIPRNYSIYLMTKLTTMSTIEIGIYFGGRDHSAIIYSKNKVKEQIKTDESVKKIIDILEENIKRKLN